MTTNQSLRIRVNGYVCEIFCGQIPRSCRDAFTHYVREHRDEAKIPDWARSRNPDYVSPEEIKQLWYEPNDVMEDLMAGCGFTWQGFGRIDDLHHVQGFGTGKQGIGIFDMSVFVQDILLAEFVPFAPPADGNPYLKNIQDIRRQEMNPLNLPKTGEEMVAVSAGSWAKGTMEFRTQLEDDFDPAFLEMITVDATQIGIGEDHLVTELRYASQVLSGTVVRETDKEMYPVSWYSPERERWLDMYED